MSLAGVPCPLVFILLIVFRWKPTGNAGAASLASALLPHAREEPQRLPSPILDLLLLPCNQHIPRISLRGATCFTASLTRVSDMDARRARGNEIRRRHRSNESHDARERRRARDREYQRARRERERAEDAADVRRHQLAAQDQEDNRWRQEQHRLRMTEERRIAVRVQDAQQHAAFRDTMPQERRIAVRLQDAQQHTAFRDTMPQDRSDAERARNAEQHRLARLAANVPAARGGHTRSHALRSAGRKLPSSITPARVLGAYERGEGGARHRSRGARPRDPRLLSPRPPMHLIIHLYQFYYFILVLARVTFPILQRPRPSTTPPSDQTPPATSNKILFNDIFGIAEIRD